MTIELLPKFIPAKTQMCGSLDSHETTYVIQRFSMTVQQYNSSAYSSILSVPIMSD